MSAAAPPAPWTGLAGAAARPRSRARAWLPAAVAACAALAVPLLPPVPLALRAPGVHVAVETGAALGVLAAVAVLVRAWGPAMRLDRLAVASGLAVIALTSAALAALLAIAPANAPWPGPALAGGLVGAAALAAGAALPARAARRGDAWVAAALCAPALAGAAAGVELLTGPVPWADPVVPDAAAVAGPLLVLLALAAASVLLLRRGALAGEALPRRVGAAAALLACAQVHYVVLPPAGAQWLHAGDALRLLAGAVLLWAAVRELWASVAARAAEGERRRIARDLHDGVAQELAFIKRRAARLGASADATDIAGAAERALVDSRWAIEHLARPPGDALELALERHACVVGARTGVAVRFAASGTAEASPAVREALARILGEAVANARHGAATRVDVELTASPLRLRVRDDGTGFDPAAPGAGFGLGGMRARAAGVGARLRVASAPGAGTEVAVELP